MRAQLRSQLLCGPPARDPVAVVEGLLAVQGQDHRGVRLAIRPRSKGLTADDVDRALTADRSLVITWLNRGTLHLVRREDYPWLHSLTTPPIATANRRRLAEEGVSSSDGERGVALIERSLAANGPMTRKQLGEKLDTAGIPTRGQALIHLLIASSLAGLAVRGPMIGSEHAYVLTRDWLGEVTALDRDTALAELARRYLMGHAPASDRDLAKWAGLPLRDVRRGLAAIASELHPRTDGRLELANHPKVGSGPPPRLLGAFDPLLLGWQSRLPLLGSHRGVVTTNGIFRPIALVDGEAVGTWRLDGGSVRLTQFEAVTPKAEAALATDAEDVARYLGIQGTGLVVEPG
ncbi:MAG TPA: winged helix DNA-binding domain-containing protein [Acidimicrobiales bacterium]|jgi:hypothetical protein|nr:winged helix DNA-binding domain-containing protein [Acidimicrobiales bacterium]